MKLIYLIAGTYRPAGMERVLAVKANWFAARGDSVMIITTDQRGRLPAYSLDESIVTYDLGVNYEENNGTSFLNKLLRYPFKQLMHRRRLAALLRREHADVVVSMFCNDASFLPRIKDGSRKILEIHFCRYKRLQYGRGGLWALADRWRSRNDRRIACRYENFVVLTEEDRGYWEAESTMPGILVIPNAISFRPIPKSNGECHHVVLAVGRLNAQKAFDRLIDAWALACQRISEEWRLMIAGDGELREELQRQIDGYGLSARIVLMGNVSDMQTLYRSADIMAMTSRYEGLPMALVEAQASALPIVAMTCKCGPRDVVTDGVDGLLVDEGDISGMADALCRMISDDSLRRSMGGEALKASARYDEDRIMRRWVELFEKR